MQHTLESGVSRPLEMGSKPFRQRTWETNGYNVVWRREHNCSLGLEDSSPLGVECSWKQTRLGHRAGKRTPLALSVVLL